MNLAKSIARNNFNNLVKNMLVFDKNIKNDLFNKSRLNTKYKYMFEGNYQCGLATYILGYYYHENFDTKILKSTIGYGKYYEDHCFLLLNDKIIVDPTIRQFLGDYRDKGKSEYGNYIFKKMDPIFVGDKFMLEEYLIKLDKINKKEFGTSSLNLSDLYLYWKGNEDITYKLDELIDYCKGKKIPKDSYNKRLLKNLI